MSIPPRVTQWVDKNYKKPRIDPEWLNDCYAWLTTEAGHDPDTNFQGLISAIEYQVLESNLCDSMLPGTGLPSHIGIPTTTTALHGIQVLVEIVSITEIAHSAFSLNQTRMAIEERIRDGNADNVEGEGDIDVEGEGPMPKYARGMLKFQLTDGTTTFPAIEYRLLPGLSLEKTSLGCKMLLKDVIIRRGIAFLEPKCVVVLGHKTDDREENREADFARGLRFRMRLPDPPAAIESNRIRSTVHNSQHLGAQSPLREILHRSDGEDLEPRRPHVPDHVPDHIFTPTPTVSMTTNASEQVTGTSSYFVTPTASGLESKAGGIFDLALSPIKQQRPLTTSPPLDPEDEFLWLDDEMPNIDAKNQGLQLFQANQIHLSGGGQPSSKSTALDSQFPKGSIETYESESHGRRKDENSHQGDNSSDDFGEDIIDLDDETLEKIAEVENKAYANSSHVVTVAPPSASSKSKSDSSAMNINLGSPVLGTSRDPIDVITIEDDEGNGDDKENIPVQWGRGNQVAREGTRPAMTRDESDVIDLSDSD